VRIRNLDNPYLLERDLTRFVTQGSKHACAEPPRKRQHYNVPRPVLRTIACF